MAAIEVLANKSSAGELTTAQVDEYAYAQGQTTGEVYDALAFYLAVRFAADVLPFEFCDSAMNFIVGLTRYDVPQFAWSVYSAFDEGEFHHAEDGRDEDPVEKYTRPWINTILEEAGIDTPAA